MRIYYLFSLYSKITKNANQPSDAFNVREFFFLAVDLRVFKKLFYFQKIFRGAFFVLFRKNVLNNTIIFYQKFRSSF